MLDEYKYPLTKILSHDQILAMRKTIISTHGDGKNTAAKKKDNKAFSYQDQHKKRRDATYAA